MHKTGHNKSLLQALAVMGGFHHLLLALLSNILEGISRSLTTVYKGTLLDTLIEYKLSAAMYPLLFAVIFSVLLCVSVAVKDAMLAVYLEKGVVRLRKKTIYILSRAEMSWLDKHHSGELSARVSNDLHALSDALRPVLILGLSMIISEAIAIIYIFRIDVYLACITFLTVCFTTFLQWISSRSIKKAKKKNQESIADISTVLYDLLAGYETVKALSLEKIMEERFAKAQKKQLEAELREKRIVALMTPLSVFSQYLPQILLIVIGAYLVEEGRITVGQLISILTLSRGVTGILGDIPNIIVAVRHLGVCAVRITDIWEIPAERRDGLEMPADMKQPIVRFENVTFSYSPEKVNSVIQDISYSVFQGQFVTIVGESGCGKTTILKLLAGLYTPVGGSITFRNISVNHWKLEQMRKQIAYVMQETYLFPDTILNNILAGQKEVDWKRMDNCIEITQLRAFINDIPEGIYTQVGELGALLSGGQRQRISIARALYREPSLLLLDEATSALDQSNEEAIISSILQLKQRPAILMITHKLKNVKSADCIIVIKDGQICEYGTDEELITRNGEYKRLITLEERDVIL